MSTISKWRFPRLLDVAGGAVHLYRSRTTVGGDSGVEPVVEGLGTQFMEDVAVEEHQNTTMTIPAGQIGNELPIGGHRALVLA